MSSIAPPKDQHVQTARLMTAIADQLELALDSLVFDVRIENGTTAIDLITVNKVHEQSFLLHTATGATKTAALENLLTYVQNHMDEENSYTIQWAHKGESQLNTSYFRSGNIREALDKCYHGQDPNSFVVFSAVLNPMS